MAYPVLVSQTSGENTTSSDMITNHTINYPASLAEGNTLVLDLGCRFAPTWTPPAGEGWTSIVASGGNNTKTQCFKKTIGAGDTGPDTFVSSSGTRSNYRIQQFQGDVTVEAAAAFLDSDNRFPDPPSLTPSAGARDYRWGVFAQNRGNGPVAGYPANYTNTGTSDPVGVPHTAAWADRQLNATSEDPGTFDFGATSIADWSTLTRVVYIPTGGASITVDGDNAVTAGQANVTITGSGFGATQGTGGVTITTGFSTNTVACPVNSWSDTSISVDIPAAFANDIAFGTRSIEVTTDAAETDAINVTYSPATGLYDDVVAPSVWDASVHLGHPDYTDPDAATGDQVYGYAATGGPLSTLRADTSFVMDTAGSLAYRFWDATDGTWSAEATVAVNETGIADNTPDAITFPDATNQQRSVTATSAQRTVSGIDDGVAISVDIGEYQINGGGWVTAPGTIDAGDDVQLRHTTSASYSTSVVQTVTIGTESFTFTSSTQVDPASISGGGKPASNIIPFFFGG